MPNTQYIIARLKEIDAEAAQLRKALRVSSPNEEISWWETDEGQIVVVADGYGQAAVFEFEGSSPDNQMQVRKSDPMSEEEACKEAELWAYGATGGAGS